MQDLKLPLQSADGLPTLDEQAIKKEAVQTAQVRCITASNSKHIF